MSQTTFEPFITAEDAAKQLEKYGIIISPKSLLTQGSARRVPSQKLNNKRRFRMSQLLAHYEELDKKGS